MSILFLYIKKNIGLCINIALLSILCFSPIIFAQESSQNTYFQLSETLNKAKTYKNYIPENVIADTEFLLNQLQDNYYQRDNKLIDKVQSRIELLDSYIANSEKKLEVKNIEEQIQKEDDAYKELEEINTKLKLEIENPQ